jgi:hypothetical protein
VSPYWVWVFSDGEEFRSQLDALLHLKKNPSLRVNKRRVNRNSYYQTDVTETFLSILNDHPYGSGR